MKRLILTIISTIGIFISLFAQKMDEIQSIPIEISYDRTLHMIFPKEIKYFSLGNDNVLAEIVPTSKNTLRLIASIKNFPGETNLSVVTADAQYYSYSITYNRLPKKSYYLIGKNEPEPHSLAICNDKNMHLIFPSKIVYEDHGTDKLNVMKPDNVDNILAIKANKIFPDTTNISVITAEGRFYTFNLFWAKNPTILSYAVDKISKQELVILDDELTSNTKEKIERRIAQKAKLNLGLNQKISGMRFSIRNIFIDNDILLFRIQMDNETNINYTIDFIRFYIQDAKIRKKTAVQQIDQPIQFMFGYTDIIPARESRTFVIAVNKFTIPDKKRLMIEIQEKNGGRHFLFKLKNGPLLEAQPLYPLD